MQIIIFKRTNKGVTISDEGDMFLSYARQILEQASLLEEKFKNTDKQSPCFSVSCQHYSFAVNAFTDVIREFDANRYDFTLQETQTCEIIEDVSRLNSGTLRQGKRKPMQKKKYLFKGDIKEETKRENQLCN